VSESAVSRYEPYQFWELIDEYIKQNKLEINQDLYDYTEMYKKLMNITEQLIMTKTSSSSSGSSNFNNRLANGVLTQY
jgi:hypothetical protein